MYSTTRVLPSLPASDRKLRGLAFWSLLAPWLQPIPSPLLEATFDILVETSSPSLMPPTSSCVTFGSHLTLFTCKWELIMMDSWVLEIIHQGCAIKILFFPPHKSSSWSPFGDHSHNAIFPQEAGPLLHQGAIEHISSQYHGRGPIFHISWSPKKMEGGDLFWIFSNSTFSIRSWNSGWLH